MSTPRAVVVSGSGRYADPWHDFPTTSLALAGIVREAGFDTEIDEHVDERLAAVGDVDLLVLNIGDPHDADPADAATRAGLLAHLAAGRPLLAAHVSSTSLRFVAEWETILGGVWVRDTTFHPDYGPGRVEIADHDHPITRGLADFDIEDELYTDMRLAADLHTLTLHRHEGAAHPLMWTHRFGEAAVVYDALGHDAASYESATHRELLRRATLWLTGRL